MTFKEFFRTPLCRTVGALGDGIWYSITGIAFLLAHSHPTVVGTSLESAASAGFFWCAIIAAIDFLVFAFCAITCIISLMVEPRYAITPEAQ